MANGRPKIAETPLELLNSPGIEPGFLNKYYTPVVGGVLGFCCILGGNWSIKRPIFSGIQRHFLFTAAGVALGIYIDKRRNKTLADRDAVFRHYIEAHPDDFPPYERKQYKDIFEKWIPIR